MVRVISQYFVSKIVTIVRFHAEFMYCIESVAKTKAEKYIQKLCTQEKLVPVIAVFKSILGVLIYTHCKYLSMKSAVFIRNIGIYSCT